MDAGDEVRLRETQREYLDFLDDVRKTLIKGFIDMCYINVL